MMRRAVVIAALLASSCYSVRPVPIDPALGPADEEVKRLVGNLRIAVVIPPPPDLNELKRQGLPPPRGTIVDYTPREGEEYPSRVHMEKSIPLALREAGFDVVPVASLEAARATGVPHILTLLDPQIEGFRRASGGGVSLEGTVYDVHVHYRARMTTSQGVPVAEVSGHGESSTNFQFEDQYLQQAVVGAAALGVMTVLTIIAATPPLLYLVFTLATQGSRDAGFRHPLNTAGDCTKFQAGLYERGTKQATEVCSNMIWLGAVVGFAALTVGTAGVTLALTKTIGNWVMGGITGFIKSRAADGIWSDMLKSAHDRAARAFAVSAARSLGVAPPAPAPAVNGATP